MREEPVRRRRRASDELEPARAGHRLVLVLGIIIGLLGSMIGLRRFLRV